MELLADEVWIYIYKLPHANKYFCSILNMTPVFRHIRIFLVSAGNALGAAAISTILIIGIIVSEIAVASLVASYLASQGGLGNMSTFNASFAAQSGIDDALMQIARNKDFSPSPNPYTLSVGGASTQVTVCKDATSSTSTPSCNTPVSPSAHGTFEITSLGTASSKKVDIRALLFSDPNTGLMTVKSILEISV